MGSSRSARKSAYRNLRSADAWLGGRTALDQSRLISKIVVATTIDSGMIRLKLSAIKSAIACFRGK